MLLTNRLFTTGCMLCMLAVVPRVVPAAAPPAVAEQPLDRPRPNVVLIISDDQRWTDYGFMGHDTIRTPNLDRLAREGARFDRGYVPTSLCRPSLATILTGLYPHQHKTVGNDPARPRGMARNSPEYAALCDRLIAHIDRVPSVAKLLAGAGYASFQSGKWWEGHYRRGGFTDGMTHGDRRRGGRHGDEGLKIGRQGMQPIFDFIQRCGGQPFFVWYAPFLPHQPHNPPPRLLHEYEAAGRPPELARYFAMCQWFDETCGQLLHYLDRQSLSDKTLVIYLADNGWIQRTPATLVPKDWRFPFAPKSKRSPYDGGTRTPIILRWPGTIRPARYDTLASSVDLAPTILRACGLEPPRCMSGINLLEACAGKPIARAAVFGEVFSHDVAALDRPEASLLFRWAIEGRWKLILPYDGAGARRDADGKDERSRPQLFDLQADPHETRNLAARQPDIVDRLRQRIDAWYLPPPSS